MHPTISAGAPLVAAPARRLGYDPTASRRDLRLDLLRGLCLLKMVFDHLWPVPLHAVTYWIGYVTAAEGFFFISGVVVGIVYGRRLRIDGRAPVARALWRRSAHLYLANLGLVFFMVALEHTGVLSLQRFTDLWRDGFAWWELLRFDQPYFLQVLPRYVCFLAAAPLVLLALERGRWRLVLLASGASWLAHLAGLGPLPWVESPATEFPILGWQLLFVVGVVAGHHRLALGGLWHRLRDEPATLPSLFAVATAFALLQVAVVEGLLTPPARAYHLLLDRSQLGPLRLLDLAVVFALCFHLVDRFWRPLYRATGPLLLTLGQHSLYVFLMHVLVVWLAWAARPWLPDVVLDSVGWALAVDAALLGLLWWMTRRRVFFALVPS